MNEPLDSLNKITSITDVSFAHPELPINCISPIISIDQDYPKYPGIHGTGFFAKRNKDIYFITAKHCLTNKPNKVTHEITSQLQIPYKLNISNPLLVGFSEIIQLNCKYDKNSPEELVDIVALKVTTPKEYDSWEQLLSRSTILPPDGTWLDKFVARPEAKNDFKNGRGITLVGIGFPSTSSKIDYGDNSQGIRITLKPEKLKGSLQEGEEPNLMSLKNTTWEKDPNGFSGSPVFVCMPDSCALAGMMVMGGNNTIHFLKISVICKAFPR